MPQGQQEDASGWGTSFGYAVLLGLWEPRARDQRFRPSMEFQLPGLRLEWGGGVGRSQQ